MCVCVRYFDVNLYHLIFYDDDNVVTVLLVLLLLLYAYKNILFLARLMWKNFFVFQNGIDTTELL